MADNVIQFPTRLDTEPEHDDPETVEAVRRGFGLD